MALNLDIIGEKFEFPPYVYNQDTVILYALGIGAGMNDLPFVYEKDLKVYPTFAVIPFGPGLFPFIEKSGINLFTLLHGEQKIKLYKPIPSSGTIQSSSVCESIWDKGDKGAVLTLKVESRDATGELLFENTALLMDRSGGNFGGDRGPKTESVNPPEGKSPDFSVAYKTSPDQAVLYRLSGDKNPLHIDPDFAKMGGFDKPILHGLCTYGYAGRAILASVCNNDPTRMKSFHVRFKGVVFPGDTLTTEGWKLEAGKYVIRTTTQDGREVLGNALVEVNA